MTLVLRPPGRGNWKPVVVTIDDSRHAPRPLEVVRGMRMVLAGQVFRVARVLA